MPTSFIVLIAAFACFASVADCKPPPRGEEIYPNRLEEDAWKRLVEQRMKRHVAGEKPPLGDKSTWKEYWTSWYRQIRISPALPWKGSQFKTDDDMIAYIKRRLKAHGLPTYE